MNAVTALPPPEHSMKQSGLAGNLGKRVASAAALGTLALVCVHVGTPAFEGMVAVGAIAVAWEWCRLCGGTTRIWFLAVLLGTLSAAVAAKEAWGPGAAVAVLALGSLVSLWAARGSLWIGVGPLYVGLPALALLWLRSQSEGGRELVFWLLAVVWAADVGAYAFGRSIGGPKLAPRVSPNKTWAGLVGGVASAGFAGFGAGLGLGFAVPWLLGLVGAGLGLVAQGGDLFESRAKRRFGVKDSSRLIPGHGGALDRLDGLMAASVALMVFGMLNKGALPPWL